MTRYLVVWKIIWIASGAAALAARKPLDPPPLVEFRLKEHINETYEQALQSLEEAMECFMEPEMREAAGAFRNTLDQVHLKEAGAKLATLTGLALPSPDCPLSAQQARQALQEAVMSLQSIVDSGGYLAEPQGAPIEFEVDEEMRVYRVRWRELESDPWRRQCTGPEVVREIPFVPKAWIFVKATYEDGRFGYEVGNDRISEAALNRARFFLGLPDLTIEQLHSLRSIPYEEWRIRNEIGSFGILGPGAGNYLIPYFKLVAYSTGSPEPGETLQIPPIVQVPWRHLPGVVSCWVEAKGWGVTNLAQGAVQVDNDPPNLVAMFLPEIIIPGSPVPMKLPRFAYHGKTIGPVPAPDADGRAAFLERIRGYFEEARRWGWVSDEVWAEEMAKEMANLDPSDLDSSRLLRLVEAAEAAYASERLLHEAHALLKYNLEHLADPANWASQP